MNLHRLAAQVADEYFSNRRLEQSTADVARALVFSELREPHRAAPLREFLGDAGAVSLPLLVAFGAPRVPGIGLLSSSVKVLVVGFVLGVLVISLRRWLSHSWGALAMSSVCVLLVTLFWGADWAQGSLAGPPVRSLAVNGESAVWHEVMAHLGSQGQGTNSGRIFVERGDRKDVVARFAFGKVAVSTGSTIKLETKDGALLTFKRFQGARPSPGADVIAAFEPETNTLLALSPIGESGQGAAE